jgi:hypothetical protein
MVENFGIEDSMIYEINITVSSIYQRYPRPPKKEFISSSGYFMKMNERDAFAKIKELRNDGHCPIPENFFNQDSILCSDYDDIPSRVDISSDDSENVFGTIFMDDKFSSWVLVRFYWFWWWTLDGLDIFTKCSKAPDFSKDYIIIEKMELINPITKKTVFTMEKF